MTDAELKEFMRDAIDAMRQSGLRTERALRDFAASEQRVAANQQHLAANQQRLAANQQRLAANQQRLEREGQDTRDQIRALTEAILLLIDEIRGWGPGPRAA